MKFVTMSLSELFKASETDTFAKPVPVTVPYVEFSNKINGIELLFF